MSELTKQEKEYLVELLDYAVGWCEERRSVPDGVEALRRVQAFRSRIRKAARITLEEKVVLRSGGHTITGRAEQVPGVGEVVFVDPPVGWEPEKPTDRVAALERRIAALECTVVELSDALEKKHEDPPVDDHTRFGG